MTRAPRSWPARRIFCGVGLGGREAERASRRAVEMVRLSWPLVLGVLSP